MTRDAENQTSDTGVVKGAVHAPLWLLALITLSGTLAMHIFVPALPLAGQDLQAGASAMQLTLSAYIIGLSIGQLTYGPISDRFGRRPVLIVGIILYFIASLAALLAPTVQALIVTRFFQALGGCAGLVLGRAIVRDSVSGSDAARRLSLMNLMVMAGPGLAPLIGSLLAAVTGWRSIFAALCVLGLVNLFLIWRLLPETTGGQGHDVRSVMRNYRQLVRSRGFLGFTIGGGCATTSIYAFIGAAPFIFIDQLHRPAHEVGVYLAINIVGAWFGSLTVNRLVGGVPMGRLMVIGNLVSCVGAIAFLSFVLAGALGVLSTVIPMLLLSYGAGVAGPTALSEALGINPSVAGSASGLYGFTQMSIGAICAALSGVGGNPALAVGIVLLSAGLLAQLSFWLAQTREI
ncbi:MAG: Bcr/CflA family drug resistance efflux transporter [Rhizobiales bacterium 62-17]|nr:multidrug effflux MFS transporter [Hyphomicrobiales bacterium]OJY03993.1 MAG: Bcr/CflA family drug resistance efflux transporter [Rhizobiales bacterium 62-17]